MRDWLRDLGKEYGIEILFACEAGSRAWGIETEQSDYDIRFIYRYREIKKYLSLRKFQDVIEFHTPYDVTGFDLYKVCHLIQKSNPSIYEWANSSLIYHEKNQFSLHLKNIIETCYSPFSLFMHYSSLKKRNTNELVKGNYNSKKQKRLIQAIRAELICRGLIRTSTVCSPFDFIQGAKELSPEIYEAYQKVTKAKQSQVLLPDTAVSEILNLLPVKKIEEILLPKVQPPIDLIENWLWSLLGIANEQLKGEII